MLNLKKQADTLKVGDIELGACIACSGYVSHLYFMQDATSKKQSKWYSCSCGVVWQTQKPSMVYNSQYSDRSGQNDKKVQDAYAYPVKVYAPLIEELIYGRKVLLIGRQTTHQEDAFRERGWVPLSIDKNVSFEGAENLINSDFEEYDFGSRKFNMIWIYHTFECFSNPISALEKIKSLLTEDGILVLCSPDTDFINIRGSGGFRHWRPETNYMMWNRRSIMKQLEKLGFNIIMARQNCWQRFPETDDFHLIAQRKFY
jgi:hypothetical protein